MQQTELAILQEFSLNLQFIENVILNHISELLNTQNIAISLSPLLNAPLFCILDKKSKAQISIKDCLRKFIGRWHQEIQYQQDILSLKDQIINEFDKLCNYMRDEKLIEVARKCSQQIVETLFAKTNFDKKQLAGEFCKSFINGFEIEMIEKIDYYATYVIWMPFTAPLPGKFIEFMKKTLSEEIGEAPNAASILSASTKIKEYIEDELKEREIQIQSGIYEMLKRITRCRRLLKDKYIITINQLSKILKGAQANKKACTLLINEVGKNDNIILRERTKIQTICLKMNINNFLKANIPFIYEYLELNDLEDGKDLEQVWQVLHKLPKCLYSASLEFKKNKQNRVKITKNEQKQVYELVSNFMQIELSYHQMQLNANLRSYVKLSLPFIILKFNYCPHEKGTNEEIVTLSNVFGHSTALQHLKLGFKDASITTNAIDNLAISIHQMNNIKFLLLNFSGNSGNNFANTKSIQLFAHAISQMLNLNHLELFFWGAQHQITDDGVVQLSQSIIKLTKIQQLDLGFGRGNNGATDKAINELSRSITNFLNLTDLRLDFSDGNHVVTENGFKNLSLALYKLTQIKTLHLNFTGGNNSINDEGIGHLSQSIANFADLQLLTLAFAEGNHKVSDEGMNQLSESIAQLKNLEDVDFQFFEGNHSIGDIAIQNLGASLMKNQNLIRLFLGFGGGNNSVTDKGIEKLSNSIASLKKIRQLFLDFGGGNNKVSDKGIEELSISIDKCKFLNNLILRFDGGNHQITDKGMQAVAATLKKTLNLNQLRLEFNDGQNTISRTGINFIAEALATLALPLDFECCFIGHPNTVTQADIEYLRNVRSYSRFDSHDQQTKYEQLVKV